MWAQIIGVLLNEPSELSSWGNAHDVITTPKENIRTASDDSLSPPNKDQGHRLPYPLQMVSLACELRQSTFATVETCPITLLCSCTHFSLHQLNHPDGSTFNQDHCRDQTGHQHCFTRTTSTGTCSRGSRICCRRSQCYRCGVDAVPS